MKKALLPVLTFVKIDIRRLFRDPLALFFTFAFPLIFLFIFGGIFGKNNSVSFKVAMLNESKSPFASQFVKSGQNDKLIKVNKDIKTQAEAEEKMSRGEIDATIILPKTFGEIGPKGYPTGKAEVLYSKNNEQAGAALGAVIGSIFDKINSQYAPTDKPFTVQTKSTAKAGLSQFDYVFAGLLGFSLMGAGIFGPINVFPKLKEKGVLRRYHTTSLRVWQYFLGNVISNVAIGLMSITAMFLVGKFVFKLNMQGNYLVLGLLVVLGAMMLFGIGLALGGWAKNERQVAPLAQIVTLPMMFLTGVFFPRFLMPEWLQNITTYVPLTPVVDGARLIITEGKGFFDLLPQFGIVAAWLVVVYLIAFRVFRWE